MSELPELRSDRLPERPSPPRQLFDKDHTYGVAHDLERMRAGLGPAPRTPRTPTRRLRRMESRRWRGGGGRRSADLWHRFRCRTGHHDFRGGHQMQFGSRFEFIERRCIWCDAPPQL
jgi:hypothetical protein